MWHEIFAVSEFIFADWRFFVFLGELIFAIRTDLFFLMGIKFCDFEKVHLPVPSIDKIFVFIECMRAIENTYFQTISHYFLVYRFVSE